MSSLPPAVSRSKARPLTIRQSCGSIVGGDQRPCERRPTMYLYPVTPIAVPGTLTTAYLALRMCAGAFSHVAVPFDQIIEATVAGEFDGKKLDAGLIIHEGQLTYARENLKLVVDLGAWWHEETGLPLP